MPKTFEEQQKELRAQVPKGTAGAAELERQGFTDVGTQPIDTSQPSPTKIQQSQDLFKVPTASKGPQDEQIFDVFAGQEHIADPNDPRLKGIDIAGLPEGTAPTGFKSKFETGFDKAKATLGDQTDVSGTQGTSLVQKYSPAKKNDLSSMFVQQDEVIGGLVKSIQDFIKPENQGKTLVENYKAMQKEAGLDVINEKLISLENIMRGTDESIRTEITRSSGFATENQVRAMVLSRNKTFLEEYSMLQRTLESKEKYLNTLVSLDAQDREMVSQRFSQGFSMLFNIAEYQQRAQQYTQDSARWVMSQIGVDGLYDSTGGDPFTVSLLEEGLSMPQGSLAQAANQAKKVKLQAQQEARLDLQLKQQQLKTPEEIALDTQYKRAQIKKLDTDTKKIFKDMVDEASGKKKLTASQYQALGYGSRLIQSGNIINDIGNQFASKIAPNFSIFGLNLVPGFLKGAEQKQFEQAKKNFVNAVLRRESGAAISPTEFESAEEQYFPKLGDDATTLQQKLENRNLVSANFLREGGMDNVDPSKLTISPSGELIELLD